MSKINDLEAELSSLNHEYKKLKEKHKRHLNQLLKEKESNKRIE